MRAKECLSKHTLFARRGQHNKHLFLRRRQTEHHRNGAIDAAAALAPAANERPRPCVWWCQWVGPHAAG